MNIELDEFSESNDEFRIMILEISNQLKDIEESIGFRIIK